MRVLRNAIIVAGLALVAWGASGIVGSFSAQQALRTSVRAPSNVLATSFSESSTTPIRPLVQEVGVTSTVFVVTRVIDGDTIELETGQHVRYIGVNAPESVHPTKPVQCFGHEASEWHRHLVEGKSVRLAKDISEVDRYGRLLRYVYLLDGTFVNLELAKQGYGYVDTFPPDVKYSQLFVAAAREAREAGRGLWRACPRNVKYQSPNARSSSNF